jgi:crossover junction endodeoxyribonuclease RuvC
MIKNNSCCPPNKNINNNNARNCSIRIIGIDPGSIYTGWGILDSAQFGRKIKLVSIGLIDAKKYTYPNNLALIFTELKQIIEEYRPEIMVIESVFLGLNPSSLIKLSQARGTICLLSSLYGISLKEYAPRYIKKNVAGYGGADKEAVRRMVYNFIKELNDIDFCDDTENGENTEHTENIKNSGIDMNVNVDKIRQCRSHNNEDDYNFSNNTGKKFFKPLNNNISDALSAAICCATDMSNYV